MGEIHMKRKLGIATLLGAFAAFAIAFAAGSGSASAQCSPCNANSEYQIQIGPTWDFRLGYANVTVKVQDLQTSVVTSQSHNSLTPGTYTGRFPNTNPGRTYGITTFTLTTLLGTAYDISCDTSQDQCFWAGTPTNGTWIKVTCTKPGNPCVKIQIQSTGNFCP
jgi:hypothetical protein